MSNNSCARYYQKTRENIQKKSRDYQNLTEEKENRKQEYGSERYKNLAETEKQRLTEYRKRYFEMYYKIIHKKILQKSI